LPFVDFDTADGADTAIEHLHFGLSSLDAQGLQASRADLDGPLAIRFIAFVTAI
jgi:hypothetical protein